MIESRRIPRATGPSTSVPQSSGPRCESASTMALSRVACSSLIGAACLLRRSPAMPHIDVETVQSELSCGDRVSVRSEEVWPNRWYIGSK